MPIPSPAISLPTISIRIEEARPMSEPPRISSRSDRQIAALRPNQSATGLPLNRYYSRAPRTVPSKMMQTTTCLTVFVSYPRSW